MEHLEPGLEQRVWQRVKNGAFPEMETLAAEAEGDRRALLRLAGNLSGIRRQELRSLADEWGKAAAGLRGAHWLVTGTEASPVPVRQQEGSLREVLLRCYDHALGRMNSCEQWTGHPRVGPVFVCLSRQAREQCGRIAELLG